MGCNDSSKISDRQHGYTHSFSGVRRKNFGGGVQEYGRPRRVSGGGDLRMSGNLRKFANNFLKKIAKRLWPIFERKFKTPALNVCAFGRNTIGWGNFEENFEWFDENLMENSIFIYFQGQLLLKIEHSE